MRQRTQIGDLVNTPKAANGTNNYFDLASAECWADEALAQPTDQ
jgi:hypothetical protein